jgi:hypothetical protein
MLEEFHLPEALFGFFFGSVGTAEILLAIFRKNFVTASHFFNHRAPLADLDAARDAKSCNNFAASLDNASRAP